MKEIIATVLFVISLFAGTHYLKEIHDSIRKAALEKAAQGLSLRKSIKHLANWLGFSNPEELFY